MYERLNYFNITIFVQIDEATLAAVCGRPYSVKRLSERFSSVNFSEAAARAAEEDILFENRAFAGAGGRQQQQQQQALEMHQVHQRQCEQMSL